MITDGVMSSFHAELTKIARLSSDVVLRPHQEEALSFVQAAKGRALLAHPTGSGKTLSGIAAYENIRGKGDKALVVLPASLRDNFISSGVRKFVPSASVGGLDGTSDYQVVSYDKLRKDPLNTLRSSGAKTIIADELHRAKDPNSKTYKAMKEVSRHADNFIGLTGSIVSNHPKDLVPLMDIVDPDHQLSTQRAFTRKHVNTETVGGGFLRKGYNRSTLKNKGLLSEKTVKRVSFLEHSDLGADLPKMEIKEVRVPMDKAQDAAYRYALKRLSPEDLSRIQSGQPVSQEQAQHIFGVITQARQVSNSIGATFNKPPVEAAEASPKLRRVMDDVEEHLKTTPDGQAVVFSHFTSAGAEPLVEGLKARGHNVGVFSGVGSLGATSSSRNQAVKDFKEGKNKIMVLTPAANEGVSLDNATAFFEVDRHYNPEKNQQAIARARRMGGQAHRDPENRKIEVRRYYSEPIPSLWQKIIGRKEVGVDEWINNIATEKDRLNADLRSSIRRKARD